MTTSDYLLNCNIFRIYTYIDARLNFQKVYTSRIYFNMYIYCHRRYACLGRDMCHTSLLRCPSTRWEFDSTWKMQQKEKQDKENVLLFS